MAGRCYAKRTKALGLAVWTSTLVGAALASSVFLTSATAQARTNPSIWAAPGQIACSISGKLSFSPPLTTSGGGTNPSVFGGKLSKCVTSDSVVTIMSAKFLGGSFSRSPISCVSRSSVPTSINLRVKWKGKVFGRRTTLPSTVVKDGIADGSFLGTPSLTVPYPTSATAKCARRGGMKDLALSGTLTLGNGEIGAAVADTNITCDTNVDWVQATTGPSAPSYAIPTGAHTLTRWSTQGGLDAGPAELEVWRPTAVAGDFVLIGLSNVETPLRNEQNSFALHPPIPVQGGDVLGIRFIDTHNPYGEGGGDCLQPWPTGNTVLANPSSPSPSLGETKSFPMPNNSFVLNVSATVG